MNGDREHLGTALGLSAGVNALLFFAIVWAMAVQRGLFAHSRAVPQEPEMREIVISLEPPPLSPPPRPEPPEPGKTPAARDNPESRKRPRFVEAPADAPEQAPSRPETALISDRSMRAASQQEGRADGAEGMATLKGVPDQPALDLRDSDFRSGDSRSAASPATAAAMPASSSASDTPPPPQQQTATAQTATAQTAPGTVPPETAPLAFRDQLSPNLVSARPGGSNTAAPPVPDPRSPLPADTPPAPVTAAPAFQSRRRAGAVSGKITSKGADAADALKTPEGLYSQASYEAFEKNWRPRQAGLKDLITRGSVEVYYEIDARGAISGVKLMNPGGANPILQDLAISSVLNAKLPPPPAELFDSVDTDTPGSGGGNSPKLRRTITFLHF